MSGPRPQLVLAPEQCDRCGRCVAACPLRALRVGGGYIYVDSAVCDSCFACVEACDRGAIVRSISMRSGTAHTPSPVGKVLVRSRAEAKALRQAEADAEKVRSKAAVGTARSARAEAAAVDLNRADAVEGKIAWTLLDAAVVLAVMLASLAAIGAVMRSAVLEAMPVSAQAGARSAVLLVFYLAQLGTLAFLARRRGTTLGAAFGLGRLRRSLGSVAGTAGIVALLLVATRLVSTLWGVMARAAGWAPPEAGSLMSIFGGGGLGLSLAVLTVVVVGPVVEELAFRGVVLRAVGARWGKWIGVLMAAAVFSAYHLTAWTLVPLFALGAALGWLTWTRRSLWAAISLHALYNGVVVAAAYWIAR